MNTKEKALLGGGILGGVLVAGNANKIIKGIAVGIVCILLALFLTWNSVNGVRETSVEVAGLPLLAAEEARDQRGLVKVYGQLSTDEPVDVQVLRCNEAVCINPETAFERDGMLYARVELQRFEVEREVEESEKTGDRVSETVNYTNKWVTKSDTSQWADVALDGIDVNIDRARTIIDMEREEVENVYIEGLTQIETFGRTPEEDEPAFGTTRALITYLDQDDREYTVVGEMRSDGLSSGDPFIVSDKSDTQLIGQLGGEETTSRWVMRFIAFALLTFGFTSMLSPILVFTDLIPVAGTAARSLATLISAILAGFIVLLTVFLLNYWWVILLIIMLAIAAFGFVTYQKAKAKETAAKK
ncbi:MAG: hypothetical protein TR69_WS6001001315 [candidate division WS6 bacterium OLB20]|uniref:Uncharacterized protein n=1 Tax=candidate division WS6 bacterium OLB20 TaxID=1617426 RepID=A0A136LWJ1_9BACT|nr:MAG: hypothetical protein TR69_WS6001001315 [candidate division WS6 bacterium OLB20]